MPDHANGGSLVDTQRIRACSIPLSSGSSQLGKLEWSELGQALVVTDDSIVVLSPLIALHPTLATHSRAHDIECHPRWNGSFPHSLIQINVKTFLDHEQTHRTRLFLEADHSALDPRFLHLQWTSATWSKPGMGPHASCLILATTSELDLFVFGAPCNAWTGEWRLLHIVDLQPVADLVQLGAPSNDAVSIPNAGDRDIFTRSRALLRKKQMATEVLCAAFVDMPQYATGSNHAAAAPHRSAYIIAGTRSGHLAVWECRAGTGQCSFLTATAVSSTAIEKITLSVETHALEADALARIAFQDAHGIRLCDFYALEDHTVLEPSALPPLRSEHSMITAWCWSGHQLVYATIGSVHVYDLRSARTTVFPLDTRSNDGHDPYSPVVAIETGSDPRLLAVAVLQDLRRYRIPSPAALTDDTKPSPLPPIPAGVLTGYPPLTESLQRKHDLHQAFMAYRSDPASSIASASLIGAVRTDERVAFLGYNVAETLRYQLELTQDGIVSPQTAVEEALAKCGPTLRHSARPYLAARLVLSLLATSQDPDSYRAALQSSIEQHWQPLPPPSTTNGHTTMAFGTTQYGQACLLYILACRLDTPSHPAPTLAALRRRHKAQVLEAWIGTQLRYLTGKISAALPSEEDRKLLARFAVAGRMFPAPSEAMLALCNEATSALGMPSHSTQAEAQEEVVTDETCAACQTQLTMRWDNDQHDFGWAKCQTGHVWPRCSVSLMTISDRQVRSCTACWAKSLVPGQPAQSEWQTSVLEAVQTCLFCGSCWILR